MLLAKFRHNLGLYRDACKQFSTSQVSKLITTRLHYAINGSLQARLRLLWQQELQIPDLIIYPEKQNDLNKLYHLAAKHFWNLHINQFTQVAQALPHHKTNIHIVVDLSRMRQILDFDQQHATVTVQSGYPLHLLNQFLRKQNLQICQEIFPHAKTVGAYLAKGRLEAFAYPSLKKMLKAFSMSTPVLGNYHWDVQQENSLGKDLFIGSQGCLGIFTEATLQLQQIPKREKWFLIRFHEHASAHLFMQQLVLQRMVPQSLCYFDELASLMLQLWNVELLHQYQPWLAKVKGWLEDIQKNFLQLLLLQPGLFNKLSAYLPTGNLLLIQLAGEEASIHMHVESIKHLCVKQNVKWLGEIPETSFRGFIKHLQFKQVALLPRGFIFEKISLFVLWDDWDELQKSLRQSLGNLGLMWTQYHEINHAGIWVDVFVVVQQGEKYENTEQIWLGLWDKARQQCAKYQAVLSNDPFPQLTVHHKKAWQDSLNVFQLLQKKLLPKPVLPHLGWE